MRTKWFNKQLVLSIFFFMIFIGAVVVNELNLFNKFTTVPVIMAKESIDKDTQITEEMIYIYQMPREQVTDSMFKEPEDVIGKTAVQLIMPNQYISPNVLDQSILRPTSQHEFFPIPEQWLMGIQGTIRRYDLVNITAIYQKKKDQTSAEALTHDLTLEVKDEFILEKVPVAYIKGGQNDEVTGVKAGDERLYGSTRPSTIQLSLTLEDFKQLEKLVLAGYKFTLSY